MAGFPLQCIEIRDKDIVNLHLLNLCGSMGSTDLK